MNGLEMTEDALSRFRDGEGSGTSVYEKCQLFDGWYQSRAAGASSSDLRAYETAHDAFTASDLFTHDLGSPNISMGDSLYFSWPHPDHIVTAIGWDYAGGGKRLLVSQTAHGGDTVRSLGNGLKISHADTISDELTFTGASHQNGSNPRRTGITPWEINKPKPKPGDDMTIHTIYKLVSRTDPQRVNSSDKRYLRLDDAGAVSVITGPADVAHGVLTLNVKPVTDGDVGATVQVTPLVETLNDAGEVTHSSSLGYVEFDRTTGNTGAQISVPPVKLSSAQRVRFMVAVTSGLTVEIASGVFRGAVING